MPFPPPGDLPDPGIEPTSLTSAYVVRQGLYHWHHLGSPHAAWCSRKEESCEMHPDLGSSPLSQQPRLWLDLSRHELVLFHGVEPHETAVSYRSIWSKIRNFVSSTYRLAPDLLFCPFHSLSLVLPSAQGHARFCLALDHSSSNIQRHSFALLPNSLFLS